MTLTAYKYIALSEDGVPVIEGTGFKVKQLAIERHAHGWSPEELQFQHPHLSLAYIYSALAYYADHRDEIDEHIREGNARAGKLESRLDSPDLTTLVKTRA